MRFRSSTPRAFAGLALAAMALGLSACKKSGSAEKAWPEPETSAQEQSAAPPAGEMSPSAATPEPGDSAGVRFIAYNLQNWLTMERYENRKSVGERTKPDKEKQAAIQVLARHKPDILGCCEIGTEDDLRDLQARLREAGVDLPHSWLNVASDSVRRLGLLSRYPISKTVPSQNLGYRLEGKQFEMSRGILDAIVDTPAGPIHFLGIHLKSKREVPEADQEMMRRAEAHLLRKRMDEILTANPKTLVLSYGDFNDTRQTSTIRTIRGPQDGPLSMKMAWLKDSRGETWTQFWSYQDVFSRFDYIFVSPPMLKHMQWDECKILDDPEVLEASDHRPVLAVFK